MYKELFANIFNLIISPKKYFQETVKDKTFRTKNLIVIGIVLILLINFLQFFELYTTESFRNLSELTIYCVTYLVGFLFLIIFRIYFISLIITKLGFDVKFKQIVLLVELSMFVYLLMFIIKLFIQTNEFNDILEIIFKIWNLIIILAGILALTEIKFIRGLFYILVMFAFEMMIIFVFQGNLI